MVWYILRDMKRAAVETQSEVDRQFLRRFWKPESVLTPTEVRPPIPVSKWYTSFTSQLELADVSWVVSISYVPVFSEAAYRVLYPLISASVEFVPLVLDEEGHSRTLYAVHAMEELDCVDWARSTAIYRPDGSIAKFSKLRLLENVIAGKPIFRMQVNPVVVVVSDAFKACVETQLSSGIKFYFVEKE